MVGILKSQALRDRFYYHKLLVLIESSKVRKVFVVFSESENFAKFMLWKNVKGII